ncbi:Testis-specific serine/threonine-protein kinase 4 [Tulasnella sp. 330]|nr:Testis-specific serine/threonine-protein kinase 4 [Tulasnella sp. 330]KAG8877443.1 Testis-specific serine/threonine-protein kinase 4 [Tulasnella sp. 331]KAG8882900.1 Testis-specific serine/threonine-protein kinase 4 [Tulasnella sp. 332]
MPSFKASFKAVQKTVLKVVSKPFKASWSKVRRGRSATETPSELGPAVSPVPVSAVSAAAATAVVDGEDIRGGEEVQVQAPAQSTRTGFSVVPTSSPTTLAAAPASLTYDLPTASYPHPPSYLPTSFTRSGANVGVQRSTVSSASASSAASYGSNGSYRSGNLGYRTESLYVSRHQTSMDTSPYLSLGGSKCFRANDQIVPSASSVHSSSLRNCLDRYAVNPELEMASSLYAAAGSAASSNASIATHGSISSTGAIPSSPSASQEDAYSSRSYDGSTHAPQVVVPARLPSNPIYKKVNGVVQMPSDELVVKFKDTKKAMEASIPTACALVLPPEHKPMPLQPELSWEDVRYLGSGTFGSVVLQSRRTDQSDGTSREVLTAVKHSNWGKQKGGDVRVFYRLMPRMEYAILKKLSGAQHVVQAHELYEDPIRGVSSMRMEYVRGVSLWSWLSWNLRSGVDWSVNTGVAIGVQLAAGLVELAKQGVIHADIKPENIMIEHDGRLVLCDFGLAHLGKAVLVPHSGSAAYMAPEIVDGIHSARDIYAAGVVLVQVLKYKCWGKDLMTSEPELCRIVNSCCRTDPRKRPSARTLLTSLRDCQSTQVTMNEEESRAAIAQQLKDDPPVKPSRLRVALWTVEQQFHAAAVFAARAANRHP